jgi:DNA repair exonuclease SbcCD nuclease subunit
VDQEGGGEDDDWYSSFFQPYRLAIARVPVFPAIGNHDSADSEGSDDRAQMEDNFHIHERFHHGLETASVTPGLFYRLRYGVDLEVACLDTSLDSEQEDIHRYFQAPQHQEWLRSTFGWRGDRWLIPFSHHPIYTAGPDHENDEEMLQALEPLFDAADVRLALAGHEHNFQVSEAGGRTYVVSGAAGQLDERVPERFAEAHIVAWAAQAHVLLIELEGPEARLTPISGLLEDGRLHPMTALTPDNQLVEPPLTVRND